MSRARDLADFLSTSSASDSGLLKYNSSTSEWEDVTVSSTSFYEQTTEPSSPVAGDTWYDESEGRVWVRAALANNEGRWIEVGSQDINTYDGGDAVPVYTGSAVDGGVASTTTYTDGSIDGLTYSIASTVDGGAS